MAVKTVTIDLEAYRRLAAERTGDESFSKIIKRHFRRGHTGAALLRSLGKMALSEQALDQAEEQASGRRRTLARSRAM